MDAKPIILEALGCMLNRGLWHTAHGLVNMTGLDGYAVREALDQLAAAGSIEVRFRYPAGCFHQREVRISY
jgi:hypothetical protein